RPPPRTLCCRARRRPARGPLPSPHRCPAVAILSHSPPHPPTRRPGPPDPVTPASSPADPATLRRGGLAPLSPPPALFAAPWLPSGLLATPLPSPARRGCRRCLLSSQRRHCLPLSLLRRRRRPLVGEVVGAGSDSHGVPAGRSGHPESTASGTTAGSSVVTRAVVLPHR
ncbi:Os09g0387150, partial [Oryza sativa Japonica Group]